MELLGNLLRVTTIKARDARRITAAEINSEVNSVRKHNYNCMLDDGIY